MYDFFIDIPFNENSSLEDADSMWSTVLILMRGVIDIAHHWLAVSLTTAHQGSEVSLTPPTSGIRL
jgi:hypothetical protein